jgi:hypothetical protein
MKAPWWIVPLLGFLLAAFGSGAIFYFAIRPQQDQIRQLEEKIRQEEAVIAQRAQAEKDLEDAKKEAERARVQWRKVREELAVLRLPDPTDSAALWAAGIAFQRESRGYFERDLRKFLAELANRCQVELSYASVPQFVLASLQMPPPPPNGYFRWGQMTLVVDGRFADILRFLEGLPQFTRPIVVQAPQFQLLPNGKVRATVPIEIYALIETPIERYLMEGKEPPEHLKQLFQSLLGPTPATTPGGLPTAPEMMGAEEMGSAPEMGGHGAPGGVME